MTQKKSKVSPRAAMARAWGTLGWLWLAAAWLAGLAFVARYGRSLLDSDMASELVLADLLNREGGILSDGWYYSTELRVVCQQLLFKLGLALFPGSWLAARLVAQGLLSALLSAAGVFCFRAAGLAKGAPWAAGVLLCPFGFWQLYHGVFGGFYFVHMLFVLVSFGLVLTLSTNGLRGPRLGLTAAALAAVSFAAGLNGVRLLMNLYVPLAAATFVLLAVRWVQSPAGPALASPRLRAFAAAGLACLGALAGYGVNRALLAGRYQFLDQSARAWTAPSLTRLLDSWGDFLALFGYPADSWQAATTGPVPLFSAPGLLGAAGLVLAAAVVFALAWLPRHAVRFSQRLTVATLAACLLVDGVAFAWMNDGEGVNGSYWLPVAPLAVAAVAMSIQSLPVRRPGQRRTLACLFAGLVVCASAGTCLRFVQAPPHGRPDLLPVVSWLEEQGYEQGCATFWQANVVTELSDGAIEMWQVEDLASLTPRPWLQKTSHAALPEGSVFVLAAPGEINVSLPWAARARVVWSDEAGWVVFELDG